MRNVRNRLWFNVASKETRADAQYARLFQMVTPDFLPLDAKADMIDRFAREVLAPEGMVADVSVHNVVGNNGRTRSIAYAMATMRPFANGEMGNKNREWNTVTSLVKWRKSWFSILRDALDAHPLCGEDEREFGRSFAMWSTIADKFISEKPAPAEDAGTRVPAADIADLGRDDGDSDDDVMEPLPTPKFTSI